MSLGKVALVGWAAGAHWQPAWHPRGLMLRAQRPTSLHQSSQLLSPVITLSTAASKTQRTTLHDDAVND